MNATGAGLSRRRFLAGGLALAGTPLLGACGSGGDETSGLDFWKSPHAEDEAARWKSLLKPFDKQHPDVAVSFTAIPWDAFDTKFTSAFVSGDPPDVFYMPDEYYPKYASKKQLLALPSDFGELESAYESAIWSGGAYDDTHYGIPFLTTCQSFLINKTLLQEHNLSVPHTWDEIRSVAQAVSDPGKGVYGAYIDSMNYFPTLLAAAGARLLSDDLEHTELDSDAASLALKVGVEDLASDNSLVPTSFSEDEVQGLQTDGRIAIMWAEVSSVRTRFSTDAPDLVLDVIPVPKVDGTDGADTAWLNSGYLFAAADTSQKDNALKLLRFLSSKEIQRKYVIDGVNNMSPMTGVTDPKLDPVSAKFNSFTSIGTRPASSVNWSQAKDVLYQQGQAVMSKQKSSADALAAVADQIDPVLTGR